MPEPTPRALEATALRYAARDLPPADAAAFEARLAYDQDAREALAEAVRLSAAALGQEPPAPHHSFRAIIRDRLRPLTGGVSRWLVRRAYRGHPLAWTGAGAAVVAAVLWAAGPFDEGGPDVARPEPQSVAEAPAAPIASIPAGTVPARQLASAPINRENVVKVDGVSAAVGTDDAARRAEIWAELSTPEHVEKAHDDDARWRQRLKDLHAGRPTFTPRADVSLNSHTP